MWCPKRYWHNGRLLEWGKGLSSEQKFALRRGEVFTLRDRSGTPYSLVLMDSYGAIRENRFTTTTRRKARAEKG